MLETFWSLLRESATFLLAGLLVAAVLDAGLAGGWLVRRLAARRRSSVLLATVVGMPLPLCSCSVLPSALALRSRGASRGSTLSFLISTPETSVTSILLTYGLLGPVMAVVRPLAACVTAIIAGLAEDARDAGEDGDASEQDAVNPSAENPDVGAPAAACCDDSQPDNASGFGTRMLAGLRYAFGDLLDDIFGWVVAGVLAAAAITTWVPPEAMAAAFGDSWMAMPLMVLIGVPLYICAEASTPLAAALVAQGVSPGAALVLLLVGPATNLGAVGVLRARLGGHTLAIYLGTIIVVAMASGVALDAWVGEDAMVLALPDLDESLLPAALENFAALIFVGLGITHLGRRLTKS